MFHYRRTTSTTHSFDSIIWQVVDVGGHSI